MALFVPERAQRGHPHRAARRQESGDETDEKRKPHRAECERKIDDEDGCWARLRVEVADHELDHLAPEHAEREADDAAEHANERGLREEERTDVARRRTDGLHDPDLARAL